MCGIAGGYFDSCDAPPHAIASRMAQDLEHRGPDDSGVWQDSRFPVALAHRRLSIIDLSPLGRQPMISRSQRYVIVFNGEIYNFRDLRQTLEDNGARFRGQSDTEVLLEGFDVWGILRTVQAVVGMFAFAVWDCQDNLLTLVRDRIGEKPLYFGWLPSGFVFASELKATWHHPHFSADISREALGLYVRYGYIPAPHSIHPNIFKLMPGSLITLPLSSLHAKPDGFSPFPDSGASSPRHAQAFRYWSADEIFRSSRAVFENPAHCVDMLDNLLRQSIRGQMVADVPLGAFLSGGIDSSTIVALMQSESTRPIKTFSIGFPETEYNEAHHAKKISAHLGTEHVEMYATHEDALKVIPELARMYDEPFSDSSQIPTFLVSKLARQYVKVAVSGDGGDELFGGYIRYDTAMRLWRSIAILPRWARTLLGKGIETLGESFWEWALNRAQPISPALLSFPDLGRKAMRVARVLAVPNGLRFYRDLLSFWDATDGILLHAREGVTAFDSVCDSELQNPLLEQLMFLDLVTYLPDDLMAKVDRASMAVSLESRAPLLDHRIVEFALKIPPHFKIQGGISKWILRQVLYQYVPAALVDRPKMGFSVPLDSWLSGPLRDWAEDLLSPQALQASAVFNPAPIRKKWAEHLSGKRSWHYQLWIILMYQAWYANVRNFSSQISFNKL